MPTKLDKERTAFYLSKRPKDIIALPVPTWARPILYRLIENPNQTLSPNDLVSDPNKSEKYEQVGISQVRKALRKTGTGLSITTKIREGYRLEVTPRNNSRQ